jgi:sugar phosphate permease
MPIVSYFSDRTLKRKPFVWGSMFVGCAAFVAAYLAGPSHFWLAFMGLIVVGSCLYTPCGPIWAWMGDILPRNVVGESMGLVNSVGALGGWFGINVVGNLRGYFHSTGAAFIFLAISFAFSGILALTVRSSPGRPKASPSYSAPQAPPADSQSFPLASPAKGPDIMNRCFPRD